MSVAFFACHALAPAEPNLNPTPAGMATCAMALVIFPMVLASASSSQGFCSSNQASTSLAVLVSPTKSIKVAPREKAVLGIFHKPVATPASADSKKPTSSSFFFSSRSESCLKASSILTAIEPP